MTYVSEVNPDSLSHTKHCNSKDAAMILKELTTDSRVFDYIPGQCHKSFKSIKAQISKHLDTHDLIINTIKQHQQSIADHMDLKCILSRQNLLTVYILLCGQCEYNTCTYINVT